MDALRRAARATVLALGLAVAFPIGADADADAGGVTAPEPPPLPFEALFGGPFSLIDHTGARRRDTDFHGRYALVYFGYTWCPDICPTALVQIAQALTLLGDDANRVQPVFISLDPERDTPAILREYVAQFHDRLIGLTGSAAEIAAVVEAYRVHRVKVTPNWAGGDDEYLVDHSSQTFVVGPDGKVRGLIAHGTPAEAIAARLRRHLVADVADGAG